MSTESERSMEAQQRVVVKHRGGFGIVLLEDVEVFSGPSYSATQFEARLVGALAANLHVYKAVAVSARSMCDIYVGDAPDPDPAMMYPMDPRLSASPIHKITGARWDTEFGFDFIAECPECNGSGKDCDQLNCETCNGEMNIQVMGDGREP